MNILIAFALGLVVGFGLGAGLILLVLSTGDTHAKESEDDG
jgi:hypothetical protein